VLLRAPDVDLAAPAHVLVFDLRGVGVPFPFRHLVGVGAALGLAVDVLEVIK
jgi:hypothetical protein